MRIHHETGGYTDPVLIARMWDYCVSRRKERVSIRELEIETERHGIAPIWDCMLALEKRGLVYREKLDPKNVFYLQPVAARATVRIKSDLYLDALERVISHPTEAI